MTLTKQALVSGLAGVVALAGLGLGTIAKTSQVEARPVTQQKEILLAQTNSAPLRVVFPGRGDKGDVQRKANAIAQLMSRELGRPVEAVVADDTAAVEALRANRADVAFLSSRPALKAEQLAGAKLYLAEVRPNYSGRYTYRSLLVVRNDSPLRQRPTSKQTLEQLRGKRMAFVSPTSGSGFIFPVGELVRQGLVPNRDRLEGFFGQVIYGGDYGKALQAVLRGQADAAAVSEYALNTPYITAEERKQLRVVNAIAGVPAHGVAIDDDIPAPQRERIINALLKLNQSENNQLLQDLYNSTQLVRVDHNRHLNPMRDALKRAGVDP